MTPAEAATELRAYSEAHPYQVTTMRPPGPDYYRMVTHNSELFKVCLTKMQVGGLNIGGTTDPVTESRACLWMLSIMKPGALPNKHGAYLPHQAEANEIAAAFFPAGYTALDDSHQIIAMTCRKFISAEPTR